MAEQVVPSEPAIPEPSGSAAVAAFTKGLAALPAEDTSTTEAPAPEAPATPEPATQSAASIVIPINQIPEKFRSKPDAVFSAYENSERAFHSKSQEAAQLRRDNDALQARIAAAEQVNRMQPAQPRVEPNLSEMVITETPRFVETVQQSAARAAAEAAQSVVQQFRGERETERQSNALIATFEHAKTLARSGGHQFTDQEWPRFVNYAARVIKDESPERLLDPNAYIEHLSVMRGAPAKPTIPAEGNPPVAARAATASMKPPAPTLSREDQQVKKQIWKALGLTEG